MSEGFDWDIFGPERVACPGICPSLVVCYSPLHPARIAFLPLRLSTITLTAGFLIVCFSAELLGRTAEAPAATTDFQRAFLPASKLAAFRNGTAVANAIFVAAPVVAKAATA